MTTVTRAWAIAAAVGEARGDPAERDAAQEQDDGVAGGEGHGLVHLPQAPVREVARRRRVATLGRLAGAEREAGPVPHERLRVPRVFGQLVLAALHRPLEPRGVAG